MAKKYCQQKSKLTGLGGFVIGVLIIPVIVEIHTKDWLGLVFTLALATLFFGLLREDRCS